MTIAFQSHRGQSRHDIQQQRWQTRAETRREQLSGLSPEPVNPKNDKDKGSDGMVDAVSVGDGWGDTQALQKHGIPMATVYKGAIGWHEMVDGQLILTAPLTAVTKSQASAIKQNLSSTQKKYLGPKVKKPKQGKH